MYYKICKKCWSNRIKKDWFKRGKQRYKDQKSLQKFKK